MQDGVRISRLKQRAEFVHLTKNGRKWVTPTLILQQAPNASFPDLCRVGFTTSKMLGNAVVRNRIRRRLREAVRAVFPQKAQAGQDYVLIGRKDALAADYAKILSDLRFALKRIHGGAA